MSSKQPVQMVTKIGDRFVNIGKCNQAQVRILTKKGHAKVENGKLVVYLRPVHLEVARRMGRRPQDDANVSQAEIDRRVQWIQQIFSAVVETDTHGSDRENLKSNAEQAQRWFDTIRKGLRDADILLWDEEKIAYRNNMDPDLPEDFPWFDPEVGADDHPGLDEEMEGIWDTAPDVTSLFGRQSGGQEFEGVFPVEPDTFTKKFLADAVVLPFKFVFPTGPITRVTHRAKQFAQHEEPPLPDAALPQPDEEGSK